MKLTRTITVDGNNADEYDAIKRYLEKEAAKSVGWVLIPEPLVNRVTAVKTEEVSTL